MGASSQYWYNCDVRCYSYRIKNDCVVFVRRSSSSVVVFVVLAEAGPKIGREKVFGSIFHTDPFFTSHA